MTNATKFLIFTTSIIITCVLCWLGFRGMYIGKDLGNHMLGQMINLNDDIKDSGIMRFDENDNVTGSDIVNFMKEYLGGVGSGEKGPVYINVVIGGKDYTYVNDTYISEVRNFTNDRYIPPTAMFYGKVVRNENDLIVGVRFVQK